MAASILDLGNYRRSGRYSSFIEDKSVQSSIPFDEGYVNGYNSVSYIDSLVHSVLLSSEEFKVRRNSGKQCCLFKKLEQDGGHLCAPDIPDKPDIFLKKLAVLPMEDFVSLCKPIIELYAAVSEKDKIGHTFEWTQIFGTDVAWLTPTNQLEVAFEYIGPRQEKHFRLVIDKDTDIEQVFDVKVYSTPHDMPLSAAAMQSSFIYNKDLPLGGAEVTPLVKVIPFSPVIDGYNSSVITSTLLNISVPTDSNFFYSFRIYERNGQVISPYTEIITTSSVTYGPINYSTRARVNSVYDYKTFSVEYTVPETFASYNNSLQIINSNCYSTSSLIGGDYNVLIALPELTGYLTEDISQPAYISLSGGNYSNSVQEFSLVVFPEIQDEAKAFVSMQRGQYSAVFYDIGGGTIGGI